MAKPIRKLDDKAQSERFKEKAREIEAVEFGETFERAVNTIIRKKSIRKNVKPHRQ